MAWGWGLLWKYSLDLFGGGGAVDRSQDCWWKRSCKTLILYVFIYKTETDLETSLTEKCKHIWKAATVTAILDSNICCNTWWPGTRMCGTKTKTSGVLEELSGTSTWGSFHPRIDSTKEFLSKMRMACCDVKQHIVNNHVWTREAPRWYH